MTLVVANTRSDYRLGQYKAKLERVEEGLTPLFKQIIPFPLIRGRG